MKTNLLDTPQTDRRLSPFQSFTRRLWMSRPGTIGLVIVLLVILTAVFSGILAPRDPARIDMRAKLRPLWFMEQGSPDHILGTDALGRDILSRLIYGSRISLIVGFVSITLGAGIGVLLGLLAGYFGGRIDALISWLMNVQLSFPFILLALFIMAAFGGGLTTLIIVLAIGAWVRYGRIMRGQVLSVKQDTYITSAIATGVSLPRILWRYVLPNSFSPIIVVASFTMAETILAEAGLSFLGLGVDPSIPSWGQMLADGRDYIQSAWWIAVVPGLVISITVLGINLFGDWLRDYLDPRLKI
jgi:peptide/nickel transport system permease protein